MSPTGFARFRKQYGSHTRSFGPRLLAHDALVKSFEEGRLFGGEWLRALGCVPNEYLWYWYFHRAALLDGYERALPELAALLVNPSQ